ncbi:MAG: hypothetical protein GTN62_05890 [Gemmatimonadales bacterium]|nr:hypothetical protein [Gemmatimonadales bacterium]NIN11029.1 hypothetical protein [Gemmatimonadales bacterium]NIN49626.1 hypothetical protein [Gemmatimonadales bacterium]NIP07090.1 hypothetical protein [Gemmatimonadales bacterium]NIQ99481.1 hypothetical protein [Gemmatimonadales bacterium]
MAYPTTYDYRVDSEDRICWVSPAWEDFARQNGAPHLTEGAVLGTYLWDYVSGEETRYLYRLMLASVRTRGRTVTLPFRCDSPTLLRHMELRIAAVPRGEVKLRGVLLREEQRPYLALLDPSAARVDKLLTICSWCKQIRVSDLEWLEPEDAVRRLKLFDAVRLPRLTHGICTSCEAKALGESDAPNRR